MEQHFYKTTVYTPNGPRVSGFWWPPLKTATKTATKINDAPHRSATSSTTGLISLTDFVNEARRLGVYNKAMAGKFAAYFARRKAGEIGEGMCRMQCNALIKNAVNKKPK